MNGNSNVLKDKTGGQKRTYLLISNFYLGKIKASIKTTKKGKEDTIPI